MYPVTATVANLFKTNASQQLSILVNPVTGSSFELTSADILSNGLSVNRYTASGDSIQIGTCVASELTMRLENGDGRFNSVVFEGAQLYVSVGIEVNGVTSWIPLGYFTVDNAPRSLAIIEISALDGMVQFDKDVNLEALNLPSSVKNLVTACCNECNVTLATDLDTLPNKSFSVQSVGEMQNMTYRSILQWCCQLMGVCGYMDWQGHLCLAWYAKPTGAPTLTTADRYSSDLYENAIQISGVLVKGVENQFLYGTDTYALVIDGNPLYEDADVETIATALSGLVGFTYHPFSASVLPMPYLYPLDVIEFVYNGNTYDVAITEISITASAPTQLKGTGESTQSRSYARLNPLTARERAIYTNLREEVKQTLNKALNNVIDFSQIISNALGLYSTDVPDGSGGTIRYLHDAQNLEDRTYIVTETAQGFAWTNTGWNSGSPVWTYGVTSGGYALFKWLSAEGIDVTKASSDYRAEVTPEHFNIYYQNELIITIDATDRGVETPRLTVPYNANSDNKLKVGKLVWIPTATGVNAVFVED